MDPERIRQSFAKQGLMSTLGASLGKIEPGTVEVFQTPNAAISQQHGFVHAVPSPSRTPPRGTLRSVS